jgi:hypothetical protein
MNEHGDAPMPARGPEPDWPALSAGELIAFRTAENARRSAPEARAITGTPGPGAEIDRRELDLPGRRIPVRVYRPAAALGTLPWCCTSTPPHQQRGELPKQPALPMLRRIR